MKFKTEPYAHQLEAFDMLKDEEYFALFCEMGTGKSKIAIDIAVYKYEQGAIDAVLLIAPNGVHAQWVREQFPTHCSVPYKTFVHSSAKKGTNVYQNSLDDFLTPKSKKLKVFAVNVEAFQSDSIVPTVATYMKTNNVFTIVDESTRIKTPTAKRSKTIHKLEKYGQRCILTGTPATKAPFGLWSMFQFLHKDYFDCNFFIFQARHGVMMQGVNERTGGRYKTLIDEKTWNIASSQLKEATELRGGTLMPDDYLAVAAGLGLSEKNVKFIEKQKTYKRFKRLDELKTKIDPITYYATKEECLDLPEKIYKSIELEMSKEHRKVYTTLKKNMLVEYAEKELTVVNKVALTTRLMQICGGFFPYTEEYDREFGQETVHIVHKKAELIGKKNLKLECIKEQLEETSSFPVIIWARFTAEIEALHMALKKDYKVALYYGATSAHKREEIIEDFKLGEYDIFLGNTQVGAFGLNLQNATTQFYYSNTFNVEERLQAEARSHRLGVKSACLYTDIVFKNTVDEKIQKAIVAGKDLNDFFKAKSLTEIFEEEV